MIRTSSKRNAGSRRNKRYRFVERFSSDFAQDTRNFLYYTVWPLATGSIDSTYKSKPDHQARTADITDCWPLVKVAKLSSR